jgi:hypothetical protein
MAVVDSSARPATPARTLAQEVAAMRSMGVFGLRSRPPFSA